MFTVRKVFLALSEEQRMKSVDRRRLSHISQDSSALLVHRRWPLYGRRVITGAELEAGEAYHKIVEKIVDYGT